MQKIEKVLQKLRGEERIKTEQCIEDVLKGNFEHLNIKKIKGKQDTYRVRVGRIRIVFISKNKNIEILFIDRRNDNTYNF